MLTGIIWFMDLQILKSMYLLDTPPIGGYLYLTYMYNIINLFLF